MALVGRDRELRVIHTAVQAVRAGRGSTLLIAGEAGMGKTRLAAEVSELATEQGMTVLTGRASSSASAPPLWPWWQALSGRPERELLPATADDALVGEALRLRWDAFDRIAASLAGSPAGTLIVLEDMHWADASSQQLVGACAGSAGVLVAVTYRELEANAALADVVTAVQSLPGTALLALPPWTPVDVAAVATHLDRTWIPLLHGGSGGNPLVLTEMVAALTEAGLASSRAPDAWPLAVPARLADITARRLARLPDLTRSAVSAVYLLDEPIALMQLAELADLDAAQAQQAVAAGVAARLLTQVGDEPVRVTAAHQLVRETGYRLIDAQARVALHRRAADLIEAGRLTGDLVAHRLRCIVTDADRERALQACRAAAAAANSRLGFDRAVAVLDAALALPGLSPVAQAELLLDAATAEYRGGAVAAALQRCRQATMVTDDADLLARSALVVRGVDGPLNHEIVALCDRALAAIPATETVPRAKVLSQKALSMSSSSGSPDLESLSTAALAMAEGSGDPQAIMLALHARHQAQSGPDHVADRVTLAERMIGLAAAAGDPKAELWGRLARVDAAFELGEPAVLRDNIARLGILADRLGWPLAHWHAHRLRAAISLLGGDFQTTDAETALARTAAKRTREDLYRALLGLLDFQRREHLGTLAEIRDEVKAFALRLGVGPVAWSNGGALLLAAGDRDAALECYERLRPVLRHLPADGRSFFTVLGASELATAFNDPDTGTWCYRRLLPYADRFQAGGGGTIICRGSVSRLLGMLAEADGDLDAAQAHLSAAIAADDRIGAVPFRTVSQLALAGMLTRRGGAADLGRARDLVSSASATAGRLGMAAALAAAGELGTALRRAARESVSLTAREREVVALLARGTPNRSIAATLFVSERTVEYHVANVFSKIGAANRTEAATWALRNGFGPTR